MTPSGEHYLVVGGTGFLGSYIVQALVARGEPHVAVLDIKQPQVQDEVAGVTYHLGDICNLEKVVEVLKEVIAHRNVVHATLIRLILPDAIHHDISYCITDTRTC